MAVESPAGFVALKKVLAPHAKKLSVTADASTFYALYSNLPSPFPQHKGKPLFFAAVKVGKAYVSFHLMPLYMCPKLTQTISPALKKRMQGKACFNFKTVPEPELIAELRRLTQTSLQLWNEKGWA